MLTQLEVYSPRVATPPFSLEAGFAETDPIQIRGIEGLGPVNASVNTRAFGSIDGEWYADSNVGKRNIVVTVGYNPNWATQSIEGLRMILYSYFMPKSRVRLRFVSTHMPTVEIVGYVESFEPNIFSKDPEVQVSIICPMPYFVSVDATVVTASTLTYGSAEFEEFIYTGSVEAGFILHIEKGAGANLSGQVQILNDSPIQETLIIKNVLVNADQYLDISTKPGNKYARYKFVSGSAATNILKDVTGESSWHSLRPGPNKFRVLAPLAGNLWTLRYYNRYGGL